MAVMFAFTRQVLMVDGDYQFWVMKVHGNNSGHDTLPQINIDLRNLKKLPSGNLK